MFPYGDRICGKLNETYVFCMCFFIALFLAIHSKFEIPAKWILHLLCINKSDYAWIWVQANEWIIFTENGRRKKRNSSRQTIESIWNYSHNHLLRFRWCTCVVTIWYMLNSLQHLGVIFWMCTNNFVVQRTRENLITNTQSRFNETDENLN